MFSQVLYTSRDHPDLFCEVQLITTENVVQMGSKAGETAPFLSNICKLKWILAQQMGIYTHNWKREAQGLAKFHGSTKL